MPAALQATARGTPHSVDTRNNATRIYIASANPKTNLHLLSEWAETQLVPDLTLVVSAQYGPHIRSQTLSVSLSPLSADHNSNVDLELETTKSIADRNLIWRYALPN